MEGAIDLVLERYAAARAAGEALCLAVVLSTAGSTYRKRGALMLMSADGQYAGLLSGGCLEQDLATRAGRVIASGRAELVAYDMRGEDDLVFGLGSGCEGAMQILMLRVSAAEHWQPLAHLADCRTDGRVARWVTVARSPDPALPAGSVLLDDRGSFDDAGRLPDPVRIAISTGLRELETGELATEGRTAQSLEIGGYLVHVATLPPRPRLLICGAGPDVRPVVQLAAQTGFAVTAVDHRAAYVERLRRECAGAVWIECREQPVDRLPELLAARRCAAAVVMSHHLPADAGYLSGLAASDVPYVGLLGPPPRREKLLADIGPIAERLRARLRAPVGLDLGGRTPEVIALSIVAELHARLNGRTGGPYGATENRLVGDWGTPRGR